MSEQKPRKYGSQISYNQQTKKYELYRLLDEAKVDSWRKAAGMEPLSEYVRQWDILFESKKK